jgi:ribonuclease H / adenosylcobalamin/alpha-ribazole phosphatase
MAMSEDAAAEPFHRRVRLAVMGTVDTFPSSSRDSRKTLGWDNPAADPTITILLRHGDTKLSPEHRFSGLCDHPLSDDGIRQAQAAARCLAVGAPIDVVVSSPLQRAVATAAIVAGELGLTAVIDDDLRETDYGDWDGFTLEEIQQRWPEVAAAWRRDPEQAPPGGESFAEAAHRVNRACDRLVRKHGGKTVLVVSHVTPIKILLCRALGVPLDTVYRLYLGSACINEIRWHDRGFATVHRVNDTSHLS